MPPDRTADPSANAATTALLAKFWNAAQVGNHYSGAQTGPLDVGPWWHLADSNFAEFDQYGKTPGCGTPFILSSGFGYLAFNPYTYGNPATGTSEFDTSGNQDHTWDDLHAKWVAHHAAGGACKAMDVGYNPAKFLTATTTAGGVTVASIDLGSGGSGVLPVGNLIPFNTYPFGPWGCGVLASSIGALYFTYSGVSGSSGAGNLTGVRIETVQRVTGATGATIPASAAVNPAGVSPGGPQSFGPYSVGGPISGAALSNAWPLQWGPTAYVALNTDNPGLALTNGYLASASLSVNANWNLNRYLDYLALEFNALEAAGVPIIYRMFPEPNVSVWWYSSALSTWYPQLWKYCVAYLTGNPNDPSTGNPIGFAGQPTVGQTATAQGKWAPTATPHPCHNVLFMFAQSYGNSFAVSNPVPGALVDLIGLDTYNTNPTAIHTKLNTMQGWSGLSNKPGGCAELYSGAVADNVARGVVLTAGDVSTMTTLTLGDDWYAEGDWNPATGNPGNIYGSTTNPAFPTGGGSIMVPTTHGIQQVNYTSCVHTPYDDTTKYWTDAAGFRLGSVVFSGCTSAAPSGSQTIVGGLVTQVDPGAGAPSSLQIALSTAISGTSTAKYPAFFVFWDGSSGTTNSELYVPGLSSIMGASSTLNRPTSSAPGDWSAFGWSEWSFA